jgi:hypothetical protein
MPLRLPLQEFTSGGKPSVPSPSIDIAPVKYNQRTLFDDLKTARSLLDSRAVRTPPSAQATLHLQQNN